MNYIDISPEIVRLAQQRRSETGINLDSELARVIAEDSILALDPELDLILAAERSLTEIGWLGQRLGVNDLVVNGQHIDVRATGAESQATVSIDRSLVNTPYLLNGSLIVEVDAKGGGRVVGYFSHQEWTDHDQSAPKEAAVIEAVFKPTSAFDLAQTIKAILDAANAQSKGEELTNKPSKTSKPSKINIGDLEAFVDQPEKISLAAKRDLVAAIMEDSEVFQSALSLSDPLSHANVGAILRSDSLWSARAAKVAKKLAPRFSALGKDEIEAQVRALGEQLGGQIDAPMVSERLVAVLVQSEIIKRAKSQSVAKIKDVVEAVLGGRSITDSVKHLIANARAVDMASVIRQQRQRIEGMVKATAEEIGYAVQQLAVKPAYQTHSQADSGVDSINEALVLLEAAQLAEELKLIGQELSAE